LKLECKDKFDRSFAPKQQEGQPPDPSSQESDEEPAPNEIPAVESKTLAASDGVSSDNLMPPVELVVAPGFYSMLYCTDLATNIFPQIDVLKHELVLDVISFWSLSTNSPRQPSSHKDLVARDELGKLDQKFQRTQFSV